MWSRRSLPLYGQYRYVKRVVYYIICSQDGSKARLNETKRPKNTTSFLVRVFEDVEYALVDAKSSLLSLVTIYSYKEETMSEFPYNYRLTHFETQSKPGRTTTWRVLA